MTLQPLRDADIDALLTRGLPALSDADRGVLTGLAEGSIGRALDLAGEGGLDDSALVRVLERLANHEIRVKD